ncbi:MAG: alpha/beta fold hydrolase [Verrucomicrobiota bacterium]
MSKNLSSSARLLITFFALFSLVGFLLLGFIWIGSSRLIIPNRPALEQRHYDLLANPARFGLELEDVEFHTHDGLVIQGILATRASQLGEAQTTREMMRRIREHGIEPSGKPRGTIILLHGRGGRKEDMLSVAKRFVAADFRCLVFDARAHGQSGGSFCTFGEQEVTDLESIIRQTRIFLETRQEETRAVGIFGISLGASVAILASEIDGLQDALVAVSPFTSLPEIAHRSGRRMIHRHLPESLSRACLLLGGWRAGFDPFAIIPIEAARELQTPLFVAHGSLDQVVPISHGRNIFAEAKSKSRSWHEVEDGYHGNVLARGGDDLYEEMILFYLRHLTDEELTLTESQ